MRRQRCSTGTRAASILVRVPGAGVGVAILQELVERLLDQAARDGAGLALFFSGMSHEHPIRG